MIFLILAMFIILAFGPVIGLAFVIGAQLAKWDGEADQQYNNGDYD